jgi:hypothetical protein
MIINKCNDQHLAYAHHALFFAIRVLKLLLSRRLMKSIPKE